MRRRPLAGFAALTIVVCAESTLAVAGGLRAIYAGHPAAGVACLALVAAASYGIGVALTAVRRA